MLDNQRKIEEKNRKGYFVEIRKDTIYFYSIAFLWMGTMFYAFLMANEKQMRLKQDYNRTKNLKMRAQAGSGGANVLTERERDKMERDKASY